MAKMMRCPNCGQEYPLSEKLSGKKVRCKKCQQVFQVPVLPTPTVAAPAEPSNILGSSPLGSGLGNILDEELLAGEAASCNDPFAAGTTLPPLPKLNPLPKPQKQGGTRETLGRGFLATHKLMLAVVVVTLLVSFVLTSSGFGMEGLISAGVGLAIAAFGLLPLPAPNTSPAGKWFALVSVAYVIFHITQIYLAIPPIPPEKSAVYFGIIIGLMIGFAINVSIITAIAFAMRRFGFFRPAAWLYMVSGLLSVVILLAITTPPSTSDTTNRSTQTSPNNSVQRRPAFPAPPTLPITKPSDIKPGFIPTGMPTNNNSDAPSNSGFPRPNIPGGPRGFGGPGSHMPNRPRTVEDHRKWVEEQRKKMEEESRKCEVAWVVKAPNWVI